MSYKLKIKAHKIFESYVYTHQLNEDGHVSLAFDKCAKEVYDFPCKNEYVYTGWNYVSHKNSCEKLENINLYHPIMIREINDPDDKDIFSIKNREENNSPEDKQIRITKNKGQKPTLHGIFHEFRHAVEMYVIDKNTIKNDYIPNIFNENIITLFSTREINFINNAKIYTYLLLPSEQRAFIDATIHYLKDNAIVKNNISILDNIKYFGILTHKYNKLNIMSDMVNELEIRYELEDYFVLIVLYMLYTKSSKITIKDLLSNKNDLNIYKNEATKMLSIAKDSYNNYVKQLYNSIYLHTFNKMK